MEFPKISIIIPVLNRASMLEKALISLFQQDYKNIQCIIIDGGSTDGTLDIIKKHASRITYWESKKDKGAVVAINNGIKKATGELVATLMADDWYEPQVLSQIAEAYLRNPNADIYSCAGDVLSVDKKGNFKLEKKYYQPENLELTLSNLCFTDFGICLRFFKKTFLEKMGLFEPFDHDDQPLFSNDRKFLLKAILHGVKHQFVPYIGYHYLSHSESATFTKNPERQKKILREHKMIAMELLNTYSLNLKQKILITYWFNDQSARLFAYELLDCNMLTALSVLWSTLKVYPLYFPISFFITSMRLIKKSLKMN